MNKPQPRGPLARLFARLIDQDPEIGKGHVFDVGANRGQTYARLRAVLPEATLHCFEPAPETFPRLASTMEGDDWAVTNQMGLGSKAGRVRFTSGRNSNNQRIPEVGGKVADEVEVEILTGDDYCRQHGIERIDFLKVDVEGYDLDVLLGFGTMLRNGAVGHLQVECTTNLDNRFHVHLERFIHFLHPFNYRLSDLAEPVRRVNKTKQQMNGIWYCNAVFAREVPAPRLRRDGIN